MVPMLFCKAVKTWAWVFIVYRALVAYKAYVSLSGFRVFTIALTRTDAYKRKNF